MARPKRKRSRRRTTPPHRRTVPARKNFKSLADLIDAQPRGLVKMEGHRLLWDYLMSSEELQRIRISPQCYRNLNLVQTTPEQIQGFYSRYKIAPHPFFPLFLSVKSQWFESRLRWQAEREQAILNRVKALPEHRRHALRLLAAYEKRHHPNQDHPVWDNRLFPRTKKRAEEFHRCTEEDWFAIWEHHLRDLSVRYRAIPPPTFAEEECTWSNKILALMVLRCRKVEKQEIMDHFRRLSLEFHPDRGGNPECFLRLTQARNILTGSRIPHRPHTDSHS